LANLFTHISYHSKNYIQQNWSSYCFWKDRIQYLSLTKGIELKPENETHITRYLFNEFVIRDVCLYLQDNKKLITDPLDDELNDELNE
jgi:hypothetical protein